MLMCSWLTDLYKLVTGMLSQHVWTGRTRFTINPSPVLHSENSNHEPIRIDVETGVEVTVWLRT